MVGAAVIAGRAALKCGAGRVYLGLLTPRSPYIDDSQPELMLRKPGELTRQWLEGRRVHFISPLRLYLTASLVFFIAAASAPQLRDPSWGDL